MDSYGRAIATVAVALFVVSALLVGGAAATTTTLEIEAALDEGDSDTVSYSFVVAGEEGEEVDVWIESDTVQSDDGVTLEFDSVEGPGSPSGTSWTAEAGAEYTVVYEAEADADATPGSYAFDFEAEDENGETYATIFSVDVEEVEPDPAIVDTEPAEVVFEPGDDTATGTATMTVENTGDGVLVPEDVTFQTPAGIDASVSSMPGNIDPGDSDVVEIEIEADDSVDDGSYAVTATFADNLGNEATEDVGVEVIRPPAVETDPETLDLGSILVGESESGEVTVSEVTDNDDVDHLEVDADLEVHADLSTDELEGLSISADDSETVEVTVEIDDDAPQHEGLSWDVELTPRADHAPTTTLEVRADVIYPPYFGTLDATDTEIEFDEPRSEVETFEQDVAVTVPNDGDLTMTVVDADASIDDGDLEVVSVDAPEEIDGLSEGTVDVEIVADADTTDGTRELSFEVESEEDGTETFTTDVEVVQWAELEVTRTDLDLGELSITEERTIATDVGERLEYKPIEDFDLQPVESPGEGWLEVLEEPETLDAGQTEQFAVSVEFDADAELFRTYEWEFRAVGHNVDDETITVRAVPRPVECTEDVEELEAFDAADPRADELATRVADGTRTVEERARANEGGAAIEDVASACTAARSALLFLESNRATEGADGDEVQEHLARMAVGFDTVEQYGTDLHDDEARATFEEGIEAAEDLLAERIEKRRATVEETLEAEDVTALEEARSQTQLTRLAQIAGDDDQAATASEDAEAAFDRYLGLVSEANAEVRDARDRNDDLEEAIFVSVAGQQLFWIADYDTFAAEQAAILDHYDAAVEAFEEAGAEEQANAVAAERDAVAGSLETTLLLSGILAAIAGLVFLFVVAYEARGIYRYVRDASEATSGEFLV